MTRAVKLNLDVTYEIFDLGEYPHLPQVIEAHNLDLYWLNGPNHIHPAHVTSGLAVDEDGYSKKLQVNRLATSLRGIFSLQEMPLVGPAVVMAGNYAGESVDVPDWTIDLIQTLKRTTDEAFRRVQDPRNN